VEAVGGAPTNPHPFARAGKSTASRKRKVKASTAIGARAAKRPGVDVKQVSLQDFNLILGTPWKQGDKSGVNKFGHALSLAAGRIHCDACSGCVPGDHYAGKQAMDAWELFDPFFLMACQPESVKLLVNKLKGFKRADFSDEFLANLKKEISEAIKHAKMILIGTR
jgi:hypothetical protein